MKTATVTWITWLNFGSFLQAYALQKILQELGHQNAIIDDGLIVNPAGASPDDWIKKLSLIKRIYIHCRRLMHRKTKFEKEQDVRAKNYLQFKKRFLNIDETLYPLSALNDRYDVFIAGSDQIWAPTDEVFKPFYYLNFATKKKISYAASVNSASYPEKFKHAVSELLGDFSHISVRENAGKTLLESFIDKNVEVNVDPTLLLTQEKWDIVASKRRLKRPYVLCYLLTYNEAYLNFSRSFAEKNGLPLYIFSINDQYRPYADKMLAAGPSEFVRAFKDAAFVLTDSFHGTVFSILYERDFLTYKRFVGAEANNQNERVSNLLGMLGIQGRFVGEEELGNLKLPPIDYCSVNSVLTTERQKARDYLQKALR